MSDRLTHSKSLSQPEQPQDPQHIAPPAAPALPQSLSRELQNLPNYKCLYVDREGNVLADGQKGQIADERRSPIVSFRKETGGSFRVYAGLPPRNSTYCDSGHIPSSAEIEMHPNIHGPVVLNSGDWVALSPFCPVKIPLANNPHPQNAAEKLAEIIASAKVGDTLVLGRKIEASCDSHVSRCHITIQILERSELAPGEFQLRILAIPGMAGPHPIFEVNPDGTLDRIIGSKRVQPGATIQIGSDGERFALPHPRGSVEEGSLLFHQSILLGDKDAHHSMRSIHGEQGLQRAQFEALKHFVVRSVALIRDENPLAALELLNKESKELAAAGYTLSINTIAYLDQITPEAIAINVAQVAHASGHSASTREISPALGALREGCTPSNDYEEQLLNVWYKNLALISAGEYIRALQDMNRGAISDYTPLFGGKNEIDPRADAALVFERLGIDLSDGHFVNLYKDKREAALAVVRGSQTEEEEKSFKASLLAAPIKAPVAIHEKVTIARTEGGYLVAPTSQETRAFLLRSTESALRLTHAETAQGGDILYIGSRKFTLPLVS